MAVMEFQLEVEDLVIIEQTLVTFMGMCDHWMERGANRKDMLEWKNQAENALARLKIQKDTLLSDLGADVSLRIKREIKTTGQIN